MKKSEELIRCFQVLSPLRLFVLLIISIIVSIISVPLITVKVVIIVPNNSPWIIGLAYWLIVFLILVTIMVFSQPLVAKNKAKEQEKATKEKQQKGNIQSEIAKLKNTIDSVEPITPQHIEKCDRWRDDDFTPIAIRELLPEHKRNVQGYNKWLEESKEIIESERAVIFQKPK